MNTTQLDLIKSDWIEETLPRVAMMLPTLGAFTTDILHERIKPEPTNRNWWGCLLAKMRNTGLVAKVGYKPSERPEANGRVIAIWRAA